MPAAWFQLVKASPIRSMSSGNYEVAFFLDSPGIVHCKHSGVDSEKNERRLMETLKCLKCHWIGTHEEMVDWDARCLYPIKCKHCEARGDYLELVFERVNRESQIVMSLAAKGH